MSDFFDALDEYIGGPDDKGDIRAVVRRCYHYDFDGVVDDDGQPGIRVWQGQGKLFTSDGYKWLGSMDADGNDIHIVPRISDGRDGTAPTYQFGFGYIDQSTYDALREEQWRVAGRTLTVWLALFQVGEGLRPGIPLEFFAEFTMLSTTFSEQIVLAGASMIRQYKVTVTAKDGNSGRSSVPGGTYTDTTQKERSRQLGVANDRGCEFVAGLANRTYTIP